MPYTEYEKIKTLIKNRKLSHAVVLEGNSDTTLKIALQIAAGLFCDEDDFYCGKCKNCATVLAHSHSDLLILEPEKTNYGIDQIRDLVNQAFLMPLVAAGRTFIITCAEKMREDSQNTLLKVLEEPPANVHFIFCTSNRSLLLSTVLSRATVFSFIEQTKGDFADTCERLLKLGVQKNRYEVLKILYTVNTANDYTALLGELKQCATTAAYSGGDAEKLIELTGFIDAACDKMAYSPSLRLLSDVLCTKLCKLRS